MPIVEGPAQSDLVVKSTRKITKAMQMVAAAKLRRAQDAAEGARPYAERMARFCQPAAGMAAGGADPLLAGTGSDECIFCRRPQSAASRRFQLSIVRLARKHARELHRPGQDCESAHRRQEGL
jgi:F-type H+-transporting ATPase subunit gamma